MAGWTVRTIRSGLIIGLFLCAASFPARAWASEGISIPATATDSDACSLVEKEHARGLEMWRAGDMSGGLDRFKWCEAALKKRALWMPPRLSQKPTPDQERALRITNNVIFSLASVYQRLGRRGESERYADMARERGLLPKVFMSGRNPR